MIWGRGQTRVGWNRMLENAEVAKSTFVFHVFHTDSKWVSKRTQKSLMTFTKPLEWLTDLIRMEIVAGVSLFTKTILKVPAFLINLSISIPAFLSS